MSESFTYILTDGNGGTDDITVVVDPVATGSTGAGQSYAVTAITGTIDGAAITGEVGSPGTVVDDGSFIYDNAVFPASADGAYGNVDGIDNDGIAFTVNGVEYNLFSQGGGFQLLSAVPGAGYGGGAVTLDSTDAPCFCAGTLIGTADGDVAVETLSIGDRITSAAGEQKTIRWIGRRAVASRFADPLTAMPIRIKAGALAEHLPARDLVLSPCHAVLVDGVLIQAGALVNGTSITREMAMPETFTYYHIELADHALILAEGAPAETFVDNTDRMGFDNWEEHKALFGNTVGIVEMAYPRAKSARQVPACIRARLALLAKGGVAVAA